LRAERAWRLRDVEDAVKVKAAYDTDAKVWYVAGETAEELAGKLANIVEDLTGTRSQIDFKAHLLVS
jgi:hypothetical protein